MHRIGVGVSTNRDGNQAGRAAAKAALKKLGASTCDFVLVYATATYDQRSLLQAIREIVGPAVICGSSGRGISVPATKRGIATHEVAVLCWTSDQLRFRSTIVHGARTAPDQAVRAALQALPSEQPRMLLVFADGLGVDPRLLIEGLRRELPPNVQVLGALSADNSQLGRTFQFSNDDIADDGLCIALLEGEFELTQRRASACLLVGQPLEVTRVEGLTVLELGGKPALGVLAEFVGETVANGDSRSDFALGLSPSDGGSAELVAIRGWDAANDALVLGRSLGLGSQVFPALVDRQRLERELETAVAAVVGTSERSAPALLLHFESASLGRLGDGERLSMMRQVPDASGCEVPWFGLYGYGELGGTGQEVASSSFTVTVASLR